MFVQRCLPVCGEYPPERIEFLVPISVTEGNLTRERWALVMDEAWESFDRTPPARLKVQIMDGPGDADRREQRSALLSFSDPTGPLILSQASGGTSTLEWALHSC